LAAAVLAPATARAQVCAPLDDGRLADAFYEGTVIFWEPVIEYREMVLTIGGPCEDIIKVFKKGEPIVFDLREITKVTDGTYTWELRRVATIDPGVQKKLEASRGTGEEDAVWWSFFQKGAIPAGPYVESASFTVERGVIVDPGQVEEQKSSAIASRVGRGLAGSSLAAGFAPGFGGGEADGNGLRPITAADQVIPDDLIVQGSECVGFDCVNNESFSFDTIRMKENNTRIHFDDTSTLAGFPANDWRIIANDSASGGASKLSIEDSTGARTPFTIRAGASTNSLFVDSTGRVGFRTSTPVLDLHISTSNTPAIRLEQNNSGGFTAQTWDVGANEANFFVRDVTGGSKLSFRIRPGAPTSSIDISADGDVGVGTASPDEKLHVEGSDGDTTLKVEETSGTATLRTMLQMVNNGGIQLLYDRTDGANDWQQSNFGGTFQISVPGAGTAQFSLNANGDLTIGGTQYLTGSSRDIKENFAAVDTRSILERVVALPMTEWSAKADETRQRHIGPIAEEWWQAFQLGPDDKHVALGDISGVALAAIQGLHSVVEEKDAKIEELQARLAALEALVGTLAKAP
jgi:hypothetical protein